MDKHVELVKKSYLEDLDKTRTSTLSFPSKSWVALPKRSRSLLEAFQFNPKFLEWYNP